MDKEIYDKLPLTRWLDKSGHPIPVHPELPVETAADKGVGQELIYTGKGPQEAAVSPSVNRVVTIQ